MKLISIVLLLLSCVGCASSEFVNDTPQSMEFLESVWKQSQQTVATEQIQLNPLEKGAREIFAQPDRRALSVEPRGLVVRSLPDAFSNWAVILCPAPCDGTYFPAYSRFGVGTYYAAYYDSTLPALRSILRYEFDSQILYRLGYNVNWR